MEVKAHVYEQGGKFERLEDQKVVNDLYLESIKAKLAMLDDL